MRVEFRFCPACGQRLAPREIEGRPLPACPACDFVAWPDPKVAVALVAHYQGRVLAIRRGIPPGQGQWALPGGYLDASESPQQGARRECLEETHCDVEVEGLACIYHTLVEGGGLLVLAYSGHLVGGEATPTEEAPELRWFEADQVPELIFSSHREALEAWRASRSEAL
ncbi:MAG TPA: NUDIX domain-containing protein [Candidatus Nanopelagicaceae bacterium]|nr:NUDIX domain-containing protein [Candidatus Nanopelagicaceae bacterium]